MTIQKEAAYHEASHAVVTHKSKYHSLVGEINLKNYGEGEIYIGLSSSKCKTNGKPADASAQKDRDVAIELAVILCAGFVGETLAAEKHNGLIPNIKCAEPDHLLAVQQLDQAGLSKKYDLHQKSAREYLDKEWEIVEKLADYLFDNHIAQIEEIVSIIGNDSLTDRKETVADIL
jgi:hypothetical protein